MDTHLNNLISGRPASAVRPAGYQADTVRDIRARANATEPSQTEQEKQGLRRLNAALSNEEPLRNDVPRGYYLNISV